MRVPVPAMSAADDDNDNDDDDNDNDNDATPGAVGRVPVDHRHHYRTATVDVTAGHQPVLVRSWQPGARPDRTEHLDLGRASVGRSYGSDGSDRRERARPALPRPARGHRRRCPLRLVNQLDVETYLKGMGEVPSNWPIEAIASQAVVARTYAAGHVVQRRAVRLRPVPGLHRRRPRGAGPERRRRRHPGTSRDLRRPAGDDRVLGRRRRHHRHHLEGFGSDSTYPYLQVVRYDTPDPLPWRAEVALSDVGSRFAYPGSVTDVKIGQAGPSGRALQVTLDGSAGPQAVDGRTFAAHLGLRSTLFQPTVTTDDNVPPPPPFGATSTQALPDDSAAIKQASLVGDTASLRVPNVSGLRDWGNKLMSLQARSAHHATDLAANPFTWIVITVALAGTFAMFARGDIPSPDAMQLIDGVRFPILRWPAERTRITTPLAKPSLLHAPPDARLASHRWAKLGGRAT